MQALDGIQVLECCQMFAGPFCSRLLADLGADVLKVEPPGTGDITRRRGPFVGDVPDHERSVPFLYLNAGKRSVTLNLESATGQELLHRLAENADVLVHDFPVGEEASHGLDPETLRAINPRLIVVSITPFGRNGPHRDWKAYDLNVFHAGGEGFLQPSGLAWELFPDRPPVKGGGSLADYQTGLTAAVGAAAAIVARGQAEQGQLVDISAQDAQLSLNNLCVMRFIDGVAESRHNRSFRFGGVVPCRDGFVEILPLEQHQWLSLVKLMGDPDWAREERFHDPAKRGQNGEEVNRRIRGWAQDKTKEWLFREGQALGLPVGPYYEPSEIYESEQLKYRGFFQPLEHPVAGAAEYPSLPFLMTDTPPQFQRPAPLLGEHTEAVLRQMKIDRAERIQLWQAGIV